MQNIFESRIKELELALANDDLNRVSRRMMDITHDFDCSAAHKLLSITLRERYNVHKELGKSGNQNENIKTDYQNLLDAITNAHPNLIVVHNQEEIICKATDISKSLGSFNLQKISLQLQRGKIIGLVGENGNGKTTLLRVLSGEISCDEGMVEFFSGDKLLTTWEEIKTELAFIPQRIERWWGNVFDQISFAAAIKGLTGEQNLYATNFIIHRLGLSNFKNHSWGELSSGYKLRVEIAKTLVWNPKVLMLDEPLANLDLMAQELLLQDLKDLTASVKHPVTLILTSQQLHEVETIADTVIFLKNGRSVFNGNTNDLASLENDFTLELDGKFTYDELSNCLADWKVKIEKNSLGYTILLSKNHTIKHLFQRLLDNNLELTYFRNISNSTKKLFNDKY